MTRSGRTGIVAFALVGTSSIGGAAAGLLGRSGLAVVAALPVVLLGTMALIAYLATLSHAERTGMYPCWRGGLGFEYHEHARVRRTCEQLVLPFPDRPELNRFKAA